MLRQTYLGCRSGNPLEDPRLLEDSVKSESEDESELGREQVSSDAVIHEVLVP
jgi:hypothetical protein